MTASHEVTVTLPGDVQQIDETGYVWSFLDSAAEPERVKPGALIVAGDAVEPFLARVVDIVDGPNGRSIVHLDVVGVPDQVVDELRHARLLMNDRHDGTADRSVPFVANDRKAGREALDRLGEVVEKVLDAADIDEDELVEEMTTDLRRR